MAGVEAMWSPLKKTSNWICSKVHRQNPLLLHLPCCRVPFSTTVQSPSLNLEMRQLATTSNDPSEEGSSFKATKRTEMLPHQLELSPLFFCQTADLGYFTSVTFFRRMLTMFVSNVNHFSCRWPLWMLFSSQWSLIFNLTDFVCAIQ